MKNVVLAAFVATMLGTTAAVAADAMGPSPSPFFGYLEGGYVFDSPIDGWQLFGPNAAPESTFSSVGPGWRGKALLGYRFSETWDLAAAVEYGSEGSGALSTDGTGDDGSLKDTHWIVDGLIGYELSPDWRASFGARWATWNSTVDTLGRNVYHDFSGIGPRIQIDGSSDLGNGMSLETSAGASVLFGHINTSSAGGWDCSDCNTENVTAFDLDASLGVGFGLGSSAKAVLGVQAQYWNGINVAITDDSRAGLNRGKSDELLAGPFLRLQF